MTEKTFASIAMAAGAGALATLTGMYISKKIRQKTTKKNRMKLHNKLQPFIFINTVHMANSRYATILNY